MTIVIKPTYACNFSCRYCYLSGKTKTTNSLLDIELAKDILLQIKECFLKNPEDRLTFMWHGGEPLLWGIKNYRDIFAFMEKEFAGYVYKNSMQTNLSLIDEDYIDLFLKYKVHVSFSLDGPKELHDSQRINHAGRGTFDVVMEKLALCKNRNLHMGCIAVAGKKHIGKMSELHQFMCTNNINFRLNPMLEAGEARNNFDDYGLTPDEYAGMSVELFDLMFFDKDHNIKESGFITIANNLITKKPLGCTFRKNCQDGFLAVSPNGDVFPCGRFCDKDLMGYAYGNLREEKLSAVLPRIKSSDAYNRCKYIEAGDCKTCNFFAVCHGGCLHDGFIGSGGFKSKTFLCGAYKKIFSHIYKRLSEAGMLSSNSVPGTI
jgi:uncharacterized protein